MKPELIILKIIFIDIKKQKITQLTDTREGREVYIELKGRFLNIVYICRFMCRAK